MSVALLPVPLLLADNEPVLLPEFDPLLRSVLAPLFAVFALLPVVDDALVLPFGFDVAAEVVHGRFPVADMPVLCELWPLARSELSGTPPVRSEVVEPAVPVPVCVWLVLLLWLFTVPLVLVCAALIPTPSNATDAM